MISCSVCLCVCARERSVRLETVTSEGKLDPSCCLPHPETEILKDSVWVLSFYTALYHLVKLSEVLWYPRTNFVYSSVSWVAWAHTHINISFSSFNKTATKISRLLVVCFTNELTSFTVSLLLCCGVRVSQILQISV